MGNGDGSRWCSPIDVQTGGPALARVGLTRPSSCRAVLAHRLQQRPRHRPILCQPPGSVEKPATRICEGASHWKPRTGEGRQPMQGREAAARLSGLGGERASVAGGGGKEGERCQMWRSGGEGGAAPAVRGS